MNASMTIRRESRPIQAIKELVIRGSVEVHVKRGEPSMMVIAERPEEVITEMRGGALTISQESSLSSGGVIDVITGRSFQVGSVGGSVRINRGREASQVFHGPVGSVVVLQGQSVVVEINLPNLPSATIEGSGDLSLEDLFQDEIELAITGSGTIRASGQVNRMSAEILGSGDVKAKELLVTSADLRVSGSGDIKAHVTHSLSARASGAGGIKVWGNPPKRDTRVSGSGNISLKKPC